jgi:transcriptional regulator with XRE-family HTH domain
MSDPQKRNAKSNPQLSANGSGLLKEIAQRPRRHSNLVGSMIAKLRYEHRWRQDDLVARLQIIGCDMTRDVLANIETRRSPVTDTQIDYFCRVFGVKVQDLFPPPCLQANRTAQGIRTSFVAPRPCRLNNDCG